MVKHLILAMPVPYRLLLLYSGPYYALKTSTIQIIPGISPTQSITAEAGKIIVFPLPLLKTNSTKLKELF